MRRFVGVLIVCGVAAIGGGAQASTNATANVVSVNDGDTLTNGQRASAALSATPIRPRNGQVIQEGASFSFDWAWGSGEYLGGPYVSRYPSMRKATQMGGRWTTDSNSGTFELSGVRGGGFTLGPYKAPFTGTWYWQVCAVSIYGEDDKCSFSGPVYRFTIVKRKVTFSFTGHRGQSDAGEPAIVLRVIARARGADVEDYKVCWQTLSGKRCTGPIDGLGSYIIYTYASRNDFAIPITSKNVIDGRFTAWLFHGVRRIATYTTAL